MVKKITFSKIIVLCVMLVLPSAFFLAALGPTATVSAQTRDKVCEGVGFTGGSCDAKTCTTAVAKGCASSELSSTITKLVNIISAVVGIASVVMIMFGGFRYITAGGDASKISTAQQTIIYALVGLVVVGFAQVLVRFVIAVAS